jgi:hypothetical protein
VYSYDIEKNHTACMNALERVGIYVIADINPRSANRASQTWDVDLLREYISRIDSLREFPNLLAFNIGNEMIKNSVCQNDDFKFKILADIISFCVGHKWITGKFRGRALHQGPSKRHENVSEIGQLDSISFLRLGRWKTVPSRSCKVFVMQFWRSISGTGFVW